MLKTNNGHPIVSYQTPLHKMCSYYAPFDKFANFSQFALLSFLIDNQQKAPTYFRGIFSSDIAAQYANHATTKALCFVSA